jgi:hypothetical protein
VLLLALLPTPLAAQPTQPLAAQSPPPQPPAPLPAPPVPEPAAATVAAATEVVNLILPPAMRDQMMEQMMGAVMQGMANAMLDTPDMRAAFEREPRARPILEQALVRQQAETNAMIRAEMPGMVTAMSRAYARRFSLAELADMKRFFSSPTGQAYVLKSPTVMSDPDVMRWSQAMITRAMDKAPAAAKALRDEINALPPA